MYLPKKNSFSKDLAFHTFRALAADAAVAKREMKAPTTPVRAPFNISLYLFF